LIDDEEKKGKRGKKGKTEKDYWQMSKVKKGD
jgi:hypothetical protein